MCCGNTGHMCGGLLGSELRGHMCCGLLCLGLMVTCVAGVIDCPIRTDVLWIVQEHGHMCCGLWVASSGICGHMCC